MAATMENLLGGATYETYEVSEGVAQERWDAIKASGPCKYTSKEIGCIGTGPSCCFRCPTACQECTWYPWNSVQYLSRDSI